MRHSLKILSNMQLGTAHRPFPTVKFYKYSLRGHLIHFETAPYHFIFPISSKSHLGLFCPIVCNSPFLYFATSLFASPAAPYICISSEPTNHHADRNAIGNHRAGYCEHLRTDTEDKFLCSCQYRAQSFQKRIYIEAATWYDAVKGGATC